MPRKGGRHSGDEIGEEGQEKSFVHGVIAGRLQNASRLKLKSCLLFASRISDSSQYGCKAKRENKWLPHQVRDGAFRRQVDAAFDSGSNVQGEALLRRIRRFGGRHLDEHLGRSIGAAAVYGNH